MKRLKFRWKALIHIFIILFSIVLLFISSSIDDGKQGLSIVAKTQTILISVACSMIASALISLLISYFLDQSDHKYNVIDEWGINEIGIRATINRTINDKLEHAKNSMDIIALGMQNFIAAKGDLLIIKIRSGFHIRILTLAPESKEVINREESENVNIGTIKKSIENLIEWSKKVDDNKDKTGQIEIKVYDSQLLDTYQNIDGDVFVGPHLYQKPSQQAITFYFRKNSRGAIYYQEIFKNLWENDHFSKRIL